MSIELIDISLFMRKVRNPDRKGAPSSGGAPPRRLTAVLAAAMLAIGVVVGAAIGPAPSPSFAVGQLLPLLPSLLRAGAQATRSTQPAAAPTPGAQGESGASPQRRHRRRHRKSTAEASSTEVSPSSEVTTPAGSAPKGTTKTRTKTTPLPPVTKVWLIELGNSSFSELAAHASAAPYITGSALPAGTLLSGWSALEAGAFANETALAASTPPQLVDTIVQPPCPASPTSDAASPQGEGAAGASCAADAPGALTAADEFLQATLPTITATAGYRESGLVVITFASLSAPAESGLPAGAANATLTSQPPAGVLLISPFVAKGVKSTATFDPTAPKQSMEKLLRR
ncbi:MAG TPA: hypothetical protein VMD79_13060 [Solirubrobacteraceae bacterium]|nr:hypothetical protein [Solirubrobacteraceae bacterium]